MTGFGFPCSCYLGRRDVGRHVAVADHALEVADLAVDVEEQPRRAVEVVHLRAGK